MVYCESQILEPHQMSQPKTVSYLIFCIRQAMFELGDLPSIDADPSKGLSNGEILTRLREITIDPQVNDNQFESGGQAA